MENSAANQLPEADSLPDGFVDSVSEPLTPSPAIPPSPATPDQEDQVTDYKEERLVEVDSRPDLVVDDFQSCEGDDGSAEQARTFPVELSEYVSNDTQKLVKPSLENHIAESDDGSPSFVSENIVRKTEPELTPLSDGNGNAGETCQSSKKATEQGVETQAANVQGTLSSESSVTSRKVTSEVKRKSIKRTFKTEKEFLEFTLSYQKVLSERDAAITMRDKLESLCRELQRQNMMLMDECKRVSTESQNLRLELLCHIEPQVPYLLYRNASQEVNGIWFYNTRECEDVANLFTMILGAYSKVPPKQKVNKSEFEELEAVPTSAVIEGPLEPGFDKRVLGKLDHV